MRLRNATRIGGGHAYLWMSARARNALRRGAVLGSIAAGVFVGALIAFILVPKKASSRAKIVAARIERKLDSTTAVQGREAARVAIRIADSSMSAARITASPVRVAPDTFPPAAVARRAGLTAAISRLNALIQRAAEAPLPATYRALAESPDLAGEPGVQALLDSLAAVEKDRASYGTVGATDPGYAALSSRAAEIGRAITAIASDKRNRLKAEVLVIKPVAVPIVQTAFTDTMRYLNARADAMRSYSTANAEVSKVRAQNARIDGEMAHARDLANLGAPPWAMLAAALVLAAALGFAGSLAFELERPTVADTREAEQIAGERVLSVIRPAATVVERSRRQVDVTAPPLIDVVSAAYQALYLHTASVGAGLPVVTVTGDEPEIVATVASNLAASSANEARSTLLVDVDASTCSVAAVLRVAPDPGLSGILSGTATWPEAITPTTIGRDRPLDVLPSGTKRTGMLEPRVTERTRAGLANLQRRYDFIVIAAPTSYVQRTATSIIPARETLLTARVGRTTLASLKSAAESLRGAGMIIQGIVLWDAPFPQLEKKEELVRAGR